MRSWLGTHVKVLLATVYRPKQVTRLAWTENGRYGGGAPSLGGKMDRDRIVALCSRHMCPYFVQEADDALLSLLSYLLGRIEQEK